MKNLYLITFFFILITSIIHSQWTNQNPVPFGNDLWSTFFVDDTGWIVGSDGFIKKTTNAGEDWIEQYSGTTLILKSVQFVDQNIGWICGESGLILKTTDGGANWGSLTSGTTENLTDICFYDTDTGYVVGFGGTILKTTNGGLVWTSLSSGTILDLNSVDFVDAFVGYAVGGEGDNLSIRKTTDGGTSWVDKLSGLPSPEGYLLAVEFIDANIGFIGGGGQYDNYIYKTTNGGDTWIHQNLPPASKQEERNNKEQLTYYKSGGINAIFFKDLTTGYAVGGDEASWFRGIYITTDGGSTWTAKYTVNEESGLTSIFLNNSGHGWVVGFKGVIFISEDDGNSWAQILSGNKYGCVGDNLYSVFCTNENIGWATGYRNGCGGSGGGLIFKTIDGGKIWKTQLYVQIGYGLIKSVYFINENFGWAVGDQFYRTTDGGENWISGSGMDGSSVFFINQNIGWVTSDDYSTGIYKSTNGGITWVEKSSISSSSVYFFDINKGWAVGEGGSILKSTDGGETWVSKTSGTTNDLNCIKFYDQNLGMCVGNAGITLLSTDGGESWSPQVSGTNNNLKTIAFTNSTSIWIAGSNGIILNSTDLGSNWTSYDGVTEDDLTSLCFINENTGWIGGMNGTMLKYQNDVVPVELVSFTAYIKNNTVQLNWKTATEENNYGFEILQTANNGQNDRWNLLGFVEGYGNSSSPKSYSFTDSPVGGNKFKYKLKQIDTDGTFEYSNEIGVEIVPSKFVLYQNYPNPFNPSTKIKYQLPRASKVIVKIYDILGAEVISLVNEEMEPGVYEVELNAQSLASGTYIYRIVAGDPSKGSGQGFVETKKMVLLH